jgi:hypothetical protein
MAKITESGFFEIDAADYHEDPCPAPSLSQSVAKKLLEQCPRAAWHAHPQLNDGFVADADTKFDRGTVAHALLLGKGREFRIIEATDYRSQKAQTLRDAYREAGLTPILMEHYATANEMAKAARDQLDHEIDEGHYAFRNEYGQIEICAVAMDKRGVWTRALIDFYGSNVPNGIVCWDYKTTSGSANPLALRFRFNDLGWAFQAAFQERIICTLKPELAGKIRFKFFVQENEKPFLCSVVDPAPDAMILAHKQAAAAIAIWHHCLASNKWPAYPSRSVPIGALPNVEAAWLARELDDELVALAANDPYLLNIEAPASRSAGAPAAATPALPKSTPAAAGVTGARPISAGAGRTSAKIEAALARAGHACETPTNPAPASKRPPGRPRLTDAEKDARKARREATHNATADAYNQALDGKREGPAADAPSAALAAETDGPDLLTVLSAG